MRELTHWQEWTVVDLIGRGSFGAVYEIERKIFGESEKAALKVISIPQNEAEVKTLRSEGYDDESITMVFNDQLQGILKEYMLMRKLNGNTNVVNCDDVQRVQHDDGMGWDIFIKMELLQPMAESLPRTVSDEQVAKIGSDICNALILCSRFNIIHRDIKPQNIFVSSYGDYKLGDFGVARTMERTAGGTKIGTYNYMAPEVYNNQEYNHTVDIYSLGLVLYWLLNERRMPFMPLPPAFPKVSDQETSRYRRFRGEALPAPKHGSDGLKAIVLKACAFDPKERYQTASEMKQALEMLGKAEEKPVESAVVIDMLTKDDPTMGAWAPVVKTPPVIEIVPVVEPVVEDKPVMKVDNIEIPTENEDKTVGMWAAIEAERERKRKEAEEAERRRIEAEQKRLAEEAAEKERQRLLEEQRIRDEKAAERKRQKELEEKKKRDEEEAERIRKLALEKKNAAEKTKKRMWLIFVTIAVVIAIGIAAIAMFGGINDANSTAKDETKNVETTYDEKGRVLVYPVTDDNGNVIGYGQNIYGDARHKTNEWYFSGVKKTEVVRELTESDEVYWETYIHYNEQGNKIKEEQIGYPNAPSDFAQRDSYTVYEFDELGRKTRQTTTYNYSEKQWPIQDWILVPSTGDVKEFKQIEDGKIVNWFEDEYDPTGTYVQKETHFYEDGTIKSVTEYTDVEVSDSVISYKDGITTYYDKSGKVTKTKNF